MGDPLEEVFSGVVNSRIFKRREILLPDYVPDFLPHREPEIRRLGSILAPALRGEKPSNVFIYGLTGTGKTAVVKYVLSRLEAKSWELGVGVKSIYINVRHLETSYRVIADIAESLGLRVPFTGLSTGEVYKRVVSRLSRLEGVYIIVLDEVDFLVRRRGDDLLYKLTRINSELGRARVSIIGITNSIDFVESLDPRVKSSLGEEEMVFPPYNAGQLRDILEARAVEAFRPGVLEDDVIPLCAALAAREHGDARRALDLLRVSGEIAERRGDSRVTRAHVEMARTELEMDRVVEVVKTLPLHGKLVLLSILAHSTHCRASPTTGEIYDYYLGLTRALGLESVTLRRVSGIIGELDMLGIVNARVVSKGRYGKTRVISLAADGEAVIKALLEDPMVGGIVEGERLPRPPCGGLRRRGGTHLED